MPSFASVPAKIILSGEYAVVFGYRGIAVPYAMYKTTAEWREGDHPMITKLEGIAGKPEYIERIVELCKKSGGPVTGTLTVTNSIPLGKGMGSSTTAVIAVGKCLLSAFGAESHGSPLREKILAIEDAINPGNSGLDFAVLWSQKPVVFRKGEKTVELTLNLDFLEHAELVDTGSPDQTTPELVAWVKSRSEDRGVQSALEAIGDCTERLLKGESPLAVFPDHHQAQIALGVVPPKVQELIEKFESGGGAAKVLGAGGRSGGGGMVIKIGK